MKNLSKIQETTYEQNEKEFPYFRDYLERLGHIEAAPKYKGEGVRKYKQPKHNVYLNE